MRKIQKQIKCKILYGRRNVFTLNKTPVPEKNTFKISNIIHILLTITNNLNYLKYII